MRQPLAPRPSTSHRSPPPTPCCSAPNAVAVAAASPVWQPLPGLLHAQRTHPSSLLKELQHTGSIFMPSSPSVCTSRRLPLLLPPSCHTSMAYCRTCPYPRKSAAFSLARVGSATSSGQISLQGPRHPKVPVSSQLSYGKYTRMPFLNGVEACLFISIKPSFTDSPWSRRYVAVSSPALASGEHLCELLLNTTRGHGVVLTSRRP